MSEERDNIIVLVDEDGEETEFELIDSFELNGNEYVVLLPAIGYEEVYDEDEDEEEVVILRVERNENDEESFVNIEDDDELDSVFEEFKSRMEDEYDFYDEQ